MGADLHRLPSRTGRPRNTDSQTNDLLSIGNYYWCAWLLKSLVLSAQLAYLRGSVTISRQRCGR